MSLETVKAAIVQHLTTEYRQTRRVHKVEGHRGRFETVDEIKRIAARCPALLVSTDGVRNLGETYGRHQGIWGDASFCIYVLTKDLPGQPRDTQAEQLVGALAHTITDNDWGCEAQIPKNVDARNLTTTAIDRLGVALWAIAWRQAILIEQAEVLPLADFERLHIDYDLAEGDGEPVATDHIILTTQQETTP
ncbi:phage protein Gp37 [uncultured Endozoicomonas sp.]|uniref:phage protein Gp37 n=1 Tax=uncultured Endozoicomonas sp. TaxID=432652 RepID=UPI00261C89AE|nr:phage protein Gp37 [uncultured Endozoicomonas sp.]